MNSRASFPKFDGARGKAVDHRLVCYCALSVFRAKRGVRQASPYPDESDNSPRRRTRPAPTPQLSSPTQIRGNSPAISVPLDAKGLCPGPRQLAHRWSLPSLRQPQGGGDL